MTTGSWLRRLFRPKAPAAAARPFRRRPGVELLEDRMVPAVSLTTLGTPYTQNFDTLSNVAGSTTNNLTLTGWFMTESGGGARDNEQYAVNTGGSSTGDTYSYGAAGITERALGALRADTLFPLFGAEFVNNTGSTVTSLAIAYTGEEWRLGTAGRTDQINFEYSLDATSLVTGTWNPVAALNFVTPETTTIGAKNGNAAGNRTSLSATISSLSIANGGAFWIRWTDIDPAGNDDGLAVDDFSITPQGGGPVTPTLNISDVTLAEGDAPGTTTFTFAVTLTSPAGPGGVTFDIATADGTAQDDNPATEDNDYVAQSLTGQSIPAGSTGPYNFSVTVNRDSVAEPNETFFVNVTNIAGANAGDTQGRGTITNDDPVAIHDVQGPGAATPTPGATVTVEGVVVGSYQGSAGLQGFFLQEEDTDADADPATSEGIFVFTSSSPTPVAEGQRVQVTGVVSEFSGMTQITATTAGSVVVTEAGNHLAEVTPTPINLPIVGVVDDFYEAREGMRVTFVDTLTVSGLDNLGHFGEIELFEGGRPQEFTQTSAPSVAGYAAHLDNLARRRVLLDDTNNRLDAYLSQPDGSQSVYYPQANGGFSVGTQGTDFFRAGDQVNGLTGVLDWSSAGTGSQAAWRIRPTQANPTTFTVANPRPVTPPAVNGTIKVASIDLQNYFTTIDTTASNTSGPAGPSGDQDARGADSVAELNRQRERLSIVIAALNADVVALTELENTTASGTITDLLGAVNARAGGAHPYAFVNTGGTLGTDAVRVALIYHTGILSPVGSPLVDLDPVHTWPPTAQTFDVVDATNPAFGQRFTVIVSAFQGRVGTGTGADADAGDGQGSFNGTRTAQANRLLAWISGTVLPAAGDPDVLLLGDFQSFAQEDPMTTLGAGGFTDVAGATPGVGGYTSVLNGQLGRPETALASSSLVSQVAGVGVWHINADESSLFDYNDEVLDTGEAGFEEKPDGSALVPPRVVFQPGSPYRASDHDPVLVGLFASPASVMAPAGPADEDAGTLKYTFMLGAPAAEDTVVNFSVGGSAVFTTDYTVTGAELFGASSGSVKILAGQTQAEITVTAVDDRLVEGTEDVVLTVQPGAGYIVGSPTPASGDINDNDTATISFAQATSTVSESVAGGTHTVGVTLLISAVGSGPAQLTQDVSVNVQDLLTGSATLTSDYTYANSQTVTFSSGDGTSTRTVSLGIADDNESEGNETINLQLNTLADGTGGQVRLLAPTGHTATILDNDIDLQVSKTDSPDPVGAGSGVGNLTYVVTVTNIGLTDATGVSLSDLLTLPDGVTVKSVLPSSGLVVSTATSYTWALGDLDAGDSATLTLVLTVAADTAPGTDVISNTATVTAAAENLVNTDDDSATQTTSVSRQVDLHLTIRDNLSRRARTGDVIVYTLTYGNSGISGATGVVLTEMLPRYTRIRPASLAAGWMNAGGRQFTYLVGDVAAAATGEVTFTVRVKNAIPANARRISNVAKISDDVPDSNNPDNNSATETTRLDRRPVAAPDAYVMTANGTLAVGTAPATPGSFLLIPGSLLLNDIDPEGRRLTAELVWGPSQGRLTLNRNGSFVYQAPRGFVGRVAFLYRAFDGSRYSDPQLVTIDIQRAGPAVTIR